MTDQPALEACDLRKVFDDRKRGRVTALDGVSFSCKPGRIFGLLGPNGAGKTTTMRILSTAIRPTSGRAAVMGHDVVTEPAAARASFGFLSGAAGLYERTTARELVEFFGELHGMDRPHIRARVDELAAMLRMDGFLDQPCGRLSDGQRQKVRLARILVHDPPVLMLDEMTAHLDILVAHEVLTFVERERDRGKTILFSTHIMSEVERLCDDVAVIYRGRILFLGPCADLTLGGRIEDAFFRLVEAADVAAGGPG